MKAKLGPAAATTATAHKIALIFYTMVKNPRPLDSVYAFARDLTCPVFVRLQQFMGR